MVVVRFDDSKRRRRRRRRQQQPQQQQQQKKKSPQQVSEEHHIVHDLWLCFVVVLWHSSLETKGLQLGICWCPWWNFDHWRCRRNCTGWTTIPRSLLKGIHPKNTHYIWCVWGWLLRGPHLKGKIFPPFSVWMNCGTEDENDASTLIEADVQFQVMEHIFCSSVYMLDGTSWFFLNIAVVTLLLYLTIQWDVPKMF